MAPPTLVHEWTGFSPRDSSCIKQNGSTMMPPAGRTTPISAVTIATNNQCQPRLSPGASHSTCSIHEPAADTCDSISLPQHHREALARRTARHSPPHHHGATNTAENHPGPTTMVEPQHQQAEVVDRKKRFPPTRRARQQHDRPTISARPQYSKAGPPHTAAACSLDAAAHGRSPANPPPHAWPEHPPESSSRRASAPSKRPTAHADQGPQAPDLAPETPHR
ncbi:unnamed protein product [Urochloa humidicola]